MQTLVTDLHWHLFKIQQCWWTSASFFVALDAAPVITGAWLPHHSYVTVILVISRSSYLSQRWSPSMLFILSVRYPCNFTTFSNCIIWYQTPSVQNIHISGTFFFFFLQNLKLEKVWGSGWGEGLAQGNMTPTRLRFMTVWVCHQCTHSTEKRLGQAQPWRNKDVLCMQWEPPGSHWADSFWILVVSEVFNTVENRESLTAGYLVEQTKVWQISSAESRKGDEVSWQFFPFKLKFACKSIERAGLEQIEKRVTHCIL